MKIKSLSRREKLILILTIVIGVTVLIFNVFISPTLIRLSGIQQDIETKTALLKKYYHLMSQGESILTRYENYKSVIKKEAHPEDVVPALFKEVENMASSLSLPLETIKPLPLQKRQGYKEISLEVELKGDFPEIFRFINKVENSPSFIQVSHLRLAPESHSSSKLLCKITFSKIFF